MDTKKLVARADYLLPRSLEDFHMQSREWLDTLAFWKDEVRFFQTLLKNQKKETADLSGKPKMLDTLETLHQHLYAFLTEEIMAHERLLGRALKGEEGISDADYRDAHRRLADKMQLFSKDFRAFKTMVFDYARKW